MNKIIASNVINVHVLKLYFDTNDDCSRSWTRHFNGGGTIDN